MKKNRMAWLFLLAAMLAIPTEGFAQAPVRLFIRGSYVEGDVAPRIVENRTLVPLRLISEALGYDVAWNDADRSIRITQNDRALDLNVGSASATVSRAGATQTVTLDVPPRIIENRTLVPLRFISENFGEKVDWDDANRTVVIGGGYSPMKNPGEMTLRFRDRSITVKTKSVNGQTMIPAADFAKAMGWNYVNKPNDYEEQIPVLHDPVNGVEIWNYGEYFACDGIDFKPMDGKARGVASKKIDGRDYLSLRHLADVLHADLKESEGEILLTDRNEATYKLFYKPLLDGGERYGYEAAKVNSIQFKNHHYFVMPLNKTPEEYSRLGIFDKEMTPMGMCNFYMNVDKNIVEAASQG